jgi:hypothetical protein
LNCAAKKWYASSESDLDPVQRRDMKKLLIIAGMLGAFILGMCTPAFTQMDHPRIRAARGHLERAREELRNAAHDYRGHRVKAIEHVDKAIVECDRAMGFPD